MHWQETASQWVPLHQVQEDSEEHWGGPGDERWAVVALKSARKDVHVIPPNFSTNSSAISGKVSDHKHRPHHTVLVLFHDVPVHSIAGKLQSFRQKPISQRFYGGPAPG